MNKQEFLSDLQNALCGLPKDDVKERISFYDEMIEDLTEDGMTEEEAVKSIGKVSNIVSQTVSDVPLAKIVKENIKPKRELKAWEIVLIILGFPLWFPLLTAAACVILSLYISLWAIIVSLWAVNISLLLTSLCGFVCAAVFAFRGHILTCTAMLGASLILTGLTILTFFGCLTASKSILRLTKKAAFGIKNMFVKRGNTK